MYSKREKKGTNMILLKIKKIMLFILLISSSVYCQKDFVFVIYQKPVEISIDLNGDKKNEKVILEQTTDGKTQMNFMKISIINEGKKVYEYEWQDKDYPMWYAQTVEIQQTPVSDEFFREMLFIITSSGTNYLNILYWESDIKEHDVYRKATSKENALFKGHYRFLKTGIKISSPYD